MHRMDYWISLPHDTVWNLDTPDIGTNFNTPLPHNYESGDSTRQGPHKLECPQKNCTEACGFGIADGEEDIQEPEQG